MQSVSAGAISVLAAVLFGLGPVSGQQPKAIVDLPTAMISARPFTLAVLDGSVLFWHGVEGAPYHALWVSDGTTAGTKVLADKLGPGTGTRLGGKVYFSAPSAVPPIMIPTVPRLWVTDGTPGGTYQVGSVPPKLTSNLITFDGALFFSAQIGFGGVGLFRYGPTSGGLTLVKEILDGPHAMTVAGDMLYFTVGSASVQTELWRTDGTASGTVKVANLPAPPSRMVAFRDELYVVVADPSTGTELWKSDGTGAGTGLFVNIRSGAEGSYPKNFAEADDFLYFSADDGEHGAELWRTDGTKTGTILVADIHKKGSSAPSSLTAAGATLYFTATTPDTGRELWQTSGSGAQLVTEVEPGPGGLVQGIHVAGDTTVYLRVLTGWTRALWVKRGTTGPVLLDLGPSVGSSLASLFEPILLGSARGKLLVVANGKLWGTETGGLSRSLGSGCGSAPGTAPLLTSGRPLLGNSVRTYVSRAPANSPGTLRIGAPIWLPLGASCGPFVDPAATTSVLSFTTNAAGAAYLFLAIPDDKSLIGVAIAHQADFRSRWPRPLVSQRSNGLLMIPGRW